MGFKQGHPGPQQLNSFPIPEGIDPMLGRLLIIANELEDIKIRVNEIEARDESNVRYEELDALEKRLNTLENELFADQLN